MPLLSDNCSVMGEIAKAEEAINNCEERVKRLECKIRTEELSEGKKKEFENELLEVQKLLTANKQQLLNLHKHNRKSFVLAAAVMLSMFVIYMFYVLIFGLNS